MKAASILACTMTIISFFTRTSDKPFYMFDPTVGIDYKVVKEVENIKPFKTLYSYFFEKVLFDTKYIDMRWEKVQEFFSFKKSRFFCIKSKK